VVVEAMKMENELRAGRPARVVAVHVRAGEAVEKGAPLVTLENVEPSG
jgi:biotin carboxyl carrier protein